MDGSGNIYFADLNHNVIREVTASTGIISTVAGNGTAGFAGDGGAATSAEAWRILLRLPSMGATSTLPIARTTAFAR